MDTTTQLLGSAQSIYARTESDPHKPERPPVYKAIGISLAVASGLFIGTSFVLKKRGLLNANTKYNEEAGEGYGYLKNAFWWTGMTLMIVGEICNFVAYAFVDAILVTPLGALSVVITTILSAIFLKERLSFVGKIGCFICIIGSVVIVMNAPEQSSAATIQDMQHFVIAPGFLTYTAVIIAGCTFTALWAGPRYGKRSMLVYLSICSLIGGLSVVATQGLGAAVVAQASGHPQFNQWFLYVLLVFVVTTLVTEILFLNKALNIFNAALVTPTYYVFFTSSTIVTSAILFRGFKGTPTSIITVVMGFFQICSGVILLQLSKSAKDVPDAALFSGDLDQVRTVAEQEEPEYEPKADAIRGAAAIIRRFSTPRQKNEAAEARRVHEERLKDQMEPIGENERVEWDGLKRRKTVIDVSREGTQRRKTMHPPWGMARFPDDDDQTQHDGTRPDLTDTLQGRNQDALTPNYPKSWFSRGSRPNSPMHPTALTEISLPPYRSHDTPKTANFALDQDGATAASHTFGSSQSLHAHGGDGTVDDLSQQLPRPTSSLAPTPPPHATRRQFSFQNVLHWRKSDASGDHHQAGRPSSRVGLGSRQGTRELLKPTINITGTEEERLGLVKGDSTSQLPITEDTLDEEDWELKKEHAAAFGTSTPPRTRSDIEAETETESERHEMERQKWLMSGIPPDYHSAGHSTMPSDDHDGSDGRAGKDRGDHHDGAFV